MSSLLYILLISQTLQLVVYKIEQQQWVSLVFQSIILVGTIILAVMDCKYRSDIT